MGSRHRTGAPISTCSDTQIHTQGRIPDPDQRHVYRHKGVHTQMTHERAQTQAWIKGHRSTHRHGERHRCRRTAAQETNVRTHGDTHEPADTQRESRTHVHVVHTPTHPGRHPEGVRGTVERQADGWTSWTDSPQQTYACAWPSRGHNYCLSMAGLRTPGCHPNCSPESPRQLLEHTCGGPALLTHVCVSQQACAPPMGADIPVLQCREGPKDSPLRHRPQAVPKGPSLVQEEGGAGGTRAWPGRAQEPVPVRQEPRNKLGS